MGLKYDARILGDLVKSNYGETSVVGPVELTGNGNVVVPAGRTLEGGLAGWRKTEHVVFTPGEALELAERLRLAAEAGLERKQEQGLL